MGTRNYIDNGGNFGAGFDKSYAGKNLYFGIREHAMGAMLNGIAYHGIFKASGSTFLVFVDYFRPTISPWRQCLVFASSPTLMCSVPVMLRKLLLLMSHLSHVLVDPLRSSFPARTWPRTTTCQPWSVVRGH